MSWGRQLHAWAERALEEGRYARAAAAAWVLRWFPGEAVDAWQLGAFVLAAERGPAEAARHLERALERYPEEMRLHVSLGNYLCDSGHHAEAHAAFQRALACPDADVRAIAENSAITYMREKRFEEMLRSAEVAATHADRSAAMRAEGLRLSALLELGRVEQAEPLARDALAWIEREIGPYDEAVAFLHLMIAKVLRVAHPEEGLRELRRVAFWRNDRDASLALRALEPPTTAPLTFFNVMIELHLPPPHPKLGEKVADCAMVVLTVAATDRDHAARIASSLWTHPAEDLRIEGVHPLGPAEPSALGAHGRSGFLFHPCAKDESSRSPGDAR